MQYRAEGRAVAHMHRAWLRSKLRSKDVQGRAQQLCSTDVQGRKQQARAAACRIVQGCAVQMHRVG